MSSKICTVCKVMKSLADFHKKAENIDDRRSQCKACRKITRKNEYLCNKDKIAAQTKIYRQNNLLLYKEASLKWSKNNPGKANYYRRAYDNSKKQRTPNWLTYTHKQQIKLFYEAANDLSKELELKIEVDHIVPLRGKHISGLHVPWNLQLLTRSQNSSKNNRMKHV